MGLLTVVVVTGVYTMQEFRHAAHRRAPGNPSADCGAVLLDVQAVAKLLSCSTRHVYRLSDAGRMPRPVRLGALVRWSRADIERWIVDGCPACRKRT